MPGLYSPEVNPLPIGGEEEASDAHSGSNAMLRSISSREPIMCPMPVDGYDVEFCLRLFTHGWYSSPAQLVNDLERFARTYRVPPDQWPQLGAAFASRLADADRRAKSRDGAPSEVLEGSKTCIPSPSLTSVRGE